MSAKCKCLCFKNINWIFYLNLNCFLHTMTAVKTKVIIKIAELTTNVNLVLEKTLSVIVTSERDTKIFNNFSNVICNYYIIPVVVFITTDVHMVVNKVISTTKLYKQKIQFLLNIRLPLSYFIVCTVYIYMDNLDTHILIY